MMKVPLIPLKRNHKTQTLFLSLFLAIFLLNLFVVLPSIQFYDIEMQIASAATTIIVFITFLCASCKNPGVVLPEKG
jgi:F0F1-type ATP synthase membrane subunit a